MAKLNAAAAIVVFVQESADSLYIKLIHFELKKIKVLTPVFGQTFKNGAGCAQSHHQPLSEGVQALQKRSQDHQNVVWRHVSEQHTISLGHLSLIILNVPTSAEFRFASVMLRARFDETRKENDLRKLAAMVEEGENEVGMRFSIIFE